MPRSIREIWPKYTAGAVRRNRQMIQITLPLYCLYW